jgi:hypothetical protein
MWYIEDCKLIRYLNNNIQEQDECSRNVKHFQSTSELKWIIGNHLGVMIWNVAIIKTVGFQNQRYLWHDELAFIFCSQLKDSLQFILNRNRNYWIANRNDQFL